MSPQDAENEPQEPPGVFPYLTTRRVRAAPLSPPGQMRDAEHLSMPHLCTPSVSEETTWKYEGTEGMTACCQDTPEAPQELPRGSQAPPGGARGEPWGPWMGTEGSRSGHQGLWRGPEGTRGAVGASRGHRGVLERPRSGRDRSRRGPEVFGPRAPRDQNR